MAGNKQVVLIQRENDKGVIQPWAGANMEVDQMAGQVAFTPRGFLGGKWSIAIQPDQVTAFQIILISDISTLGMMYGGGLLGYGIAWFMSRWVKMPALKIEQLNAPMGQRTVSIRATGFQPRKRTRDVANQLATLLRERGSKVMMPDLADDTVWKFPLVPILAGLALLVVLLLGLFVCVAFVSSQN